MIIHISPCAVNLYTPMVYAAATRNVSEPPLDCYSKVAFAQAQGGLEPVDRSSAGIERGCSVFGQHK